MLIHPRARRELVHRCLLDPAGARSGHVLETGLRDSQFGLLEAPLESAIVACEVLALDQQSEAFVEAQLAHVGVALLLLPLLPCGGHRAEPHHVELVQDRFIPHFYVLVFVWSVE